MLPRLAPGPLTAGARFAFKTLVKVGQGLLLWTEYCAGRIACLPPAGRTKAGTRFLSLGENGQSPQHLYFLQTFSLNQTDRSFAAGFGRKQGSFFPPPSLSGAQDKSGLHTQHASL